MMMAAECGNNGELEVNRLSSGMASGKSTEKNNRSLQLAKSSNESKKSFQFKSFVERKVPNPPKRSLFLAKQKHHRRLKKVHFLLEKKSPGHWWRSNPFDFRNPHVQRWKLFMLIPLAYEVWAFPYRLALGVPSISSEMQLIVADFTCDLFILIDMFISLTTEIPIGPDSAEPITTFSGIADHYFRSKFQLQILPSFPYWAATFYVTNHIQGACRVGFDPASFSWTCIVLNQDWPVWLWWASSVPRLVPRLFRLTRDFSAMESNLEITVRALQGFKFAILIFLAAHWVGCIFFFIARTLTLGPKTWVYDMESLLPLYSRFGSAISVDYLLCIYKGFNGISDLEYIIEYPNNIGEILFNMVVMVIAIWLQGMILGTILNYMVAKDPVQEAHKKQMEELAQFADAKNLPQDLTGRLFSYFKFQHQKTVENRASSSVQLPRSLAIKLSECKYRAVIDKCTARGEFLFGCNLQFLTALLMKLKVVFYMPNEEVLKKDDLSRQLCLVLSGSCHLIQDDKIKRVVRDDVPNMAPVFGELAFFLGIVQPMAVRARPDGDIQLLVLTKEDGDELFDNYPEQLDIICGNLLDSFGLDRYGNETAYGQEDDTDSMQLRNSIKQALIRKQYETFAALTFAAKAGDVETVRDLLRRGAAINAVDFDGRSALAMACYEGSYKVVELLLEEGVDKDVKNRWNQTALEEAMCNRQGPVIELLTQWSAGTDLQKAPEELRNAASRGDVDQLRRLTDRKIELDSGDYDQRTALHLACFQGHLRAVEHLVSCKANINIKDRWGITPLQDAVDRGHQQLASLLRSKGATMSPLRGVQSVSDAASRGDVPALNLFVKYAGLKPNVIDFDIRTPLHRAATEGKMLATSYLLGIAAEPNAKDRWGHTPLDLALRGRTKYHMYCAILIHGWGGRVGVLKDTEEGAELMRQVEMYNMDDVRKLIAQLMDKEYNRRPPQGNNEQETLRNWESSLEIVKMLNGINEAVETELEHVQSKMTKVREAFDFFQSTFVDFLGAVPLKGTKQGSFLDDDLRESLHSLEWAYCQGHDPDEEGDAMFGVDSDEEARLFEEIDYLLDAQERALSFKADSHKFMAISMQRAFLRTSELEEAFTLLCNAFRIFNDEGEPFVTAADGLQIALERLGIVNITEFELECMIQDGSNCAKECNHIFKSIQVPEDLGKEIPLSCLIAGSEILRKSLLRLNTDPIFCALMQTPFSSFLSHSQLKKLCSGGREVEVGRMGSAVYLSQEENKKCCILTRGKLKAKIDIPEAKTKLQKNLPTSSCQIGSGELFGGYAVWKGQKDPFQMRVEVLEPCTFIELDPRNVEAIFIEDTNIAMKVLFALGGPWTQLADSSGLEWGARKDADESEQEAGLESGSEIGDFAVDLILAHSDDIVPETEHLVPCENRSISSSNKTDDQRITEMHLYTIKTAFAIIENLWRDVSAGSGEIQMTTLISISENLGEIGEEWFARLFLKNPSMSQISHRDFWALWMRFLVEEIFLEDQIELEPKAEEMAKSINVEEAQPTGEEDIAFADNDQAEDLQESLSLYEIIHARYAPQRRLKNRFFEEHVLERYEMAFLYVSGDLKRSISKAKIPKFLDMLFPAFKHRFSSYNVDEALEFFGRNGVKSREIHWSEVRKALRDNRGLNNQSGATFIGSAFNPGSPAMRRWKHLITFVAVYYFIAVPIRIGFLPWPSMLDIRALCTDLIADIITVLNVLVLANTASMNSQGAWITKPRKLIRRMTIGYILAAVPLDWFAWACGASNALSCWVRLPRLLFPLALMTSRSRVDVTSGAQEMSERRSSFMLLCYVGGVVHIGGCIWYYIGVQYASWFPGRGISWLAVDPSLEQVSFTDHNGKFGMQPTDTVWVRYVASFYWVATGLTSTGLVGDVIPSNLVEICFTIVVMVLNLTLYRYVTGEVSSIVMRKDEKIVANRTRLEAVETLLQDTRINRDLRNEIRGHFRVAQSQNMIDISALFSKMSHSLKVEVSSNIAREYLDNVALFQGCGEKLLDSISVLLREVQFAPEEYLYRVGEIAHEMFFVTSGSIEELGEKSKLGVEKLERTVETGGGSGELPFFFGIRHFVGARASKRTGAICLRLPRAQFLPLLKLFPDDEERIARAALTSFDVKSQHARSKKSGSVAQRSKSNSKSTKSHSTQRIEIPEDGNGENGSVIAKSEASAESQDSTSGDVSNHRIEELKLRRRNDRINQTLFAAAKGDLELLTQGIKSEGINMHDALKRTPLHIAASEGQLAAVRFLIENGADVNAADWFQNTCLNDAVRHRHDEVAKLLKDEGASLVLEGTMGGKLMCRAAFVGNVDEVERLIRNGVSASASDDRGRTPLHVAASEGHQQLVTFLLENKAEVDLRDRFGGSPLDDAVRHGHGDIQRLLREHGGTLDVSTSAYNMCEYAARGDLDAIRTLVENGVDPTVGSYDQRTAAHVAAANGMIHILYYLFSLPNSEPNPVDKFGGTPMEDAIRHDRGSAVKMLEERGGLPASHPSIPELKQAQTVRHAKVQRSHRLKCVEKIVEESLEMKGKHLLFEAYIPGVRAALDELENRASRLHSAMEDCIPAMQEVLVKCGILDPEISMTPITRRPSSRNVKKVIDATLKRMTEFAATAAATMEALSADFSRYRSVQLFAQGLFQEAAAIRVFLKICVKIAKKCKKPLQELLTLSTARGRAVNSKQSMRGSVEFAPTLPPSSRTFSNSTAAAGGGGSGNVSPIAARSPLSGGGPGRTLARAGSEGQLQGLPMPARRALGRSCSPGTAHALGGAAGQPDGSYGGRPAPLVFADGENGRGGSGRGSPPRLATATLPAAAAAAEEAAPRSSSPSPTPQVTSHVVRGGFAPVGRLRAAGSEDFAAPAAAVTGHSPWASPRARAPAGESDGSGGGGREIPIEGGGVEGTAAAAGGRNVGDRRQGGGGVDEDGVLVLAPAPSSRRGGGGWRVEGGGGGGALGGGGGVGGGVDGDEAGVGNVGSGGAAGGSTAAAPPAGIGGGRIGGDCGGGGEAIVAVAGSGDGGGVWGRMLAMGAVEEVPIMSASFLYTGDVSSPPSGGGGGGGRGGGGGGGGGGAR